MEGYKEVMVSQPPAMYAQPTATANISLENYKGILLCDRPVSASPYVGSVAPGASGPKAFVTGGKTAEPIGLGVSQERRLQLVDNQQKRAANIQARRVKSNEVLQRHRRWLHSFAKQVKEMKDADLQREVEAAHKAARLREAAMKKAAQQPQQGGEEEEDEEVSRAAKEAVLRSMPEPYNMQTELDPWRGQAARNVKRGASKKPRWAMTADEALDDELGCNDDLLEFAKNLDYEKFINDYEVTEALQVMRDRVREIARANNWTEEDILDAAGEHHSAAPPPQQSGGVRLQVPAGAAQTAEARGAVPGQAAEHDAEWDSSTGRGGLLRSAISQDALALAARLLASSPSMQKIHTKQSLARVLQRCVLSGDNNVMEAAQRGAPDWGKMTPDELRAFTAMGPAVVQNPIVSQVSADASDACPAPRVLYAMQNSKERTQGLPYMYRCPAI